MRQIAAKIKHRDEYPEINKLDFGRIKVQYSRHALDRAAEKQIQLPIYITAGSGSVVEITVGPSGRPVKILVRLPYNTDFDLCLPLVPNGAAGSLTAVTVWLNSVNDLHATRKLVA